MATLWINRFLVSNTTGTTVLASGAINQSGRISAVILPTASGIPTAAQIYAGQNASGQAVPTGHSDYENVAASGTYASLSGYNLTSETAYKMYLVASGYHTTDGGLLASGYALEFTTPDITIPAWSAGYPVASALTITTVTGSIKFTDDGTAYVVILPSGATAPSAAQIRAGTDSTGTAVASNCATSTSVVANTAKTVTMSGLDYGTRYTAHMTMRDDSGNDLAAVSSLSFRTSVPPPGLAAISGRLMRKRRDRRIRTGIGISMLR